MDPNNNLGIQRFLSPWDTHQLLILDWYCNYDTHGYVLWYYSWCWLLIPYIHLYSRIILLYTLGQTLGLPRVSHSIYLPTLFTIYSVVYWAKRTLKMPCSLMLTIFLSCRSKRRTQSFSPLCTDLVFWAGVGTSHGSYKLQPRPCSWFHTSISKTKSLVVHICWMLHSIFLHTLLQVRAPLQQPCV